MHESHRRALEAVNTPVICLCGRWFCRHAPTDEEGRAAALEGSTRHSLHESEIALRRLEAIHKILTTADGTFLATVLGEYPRTQEKTP